MRFLLINGSKGRVTHSLMSQIIGGVTTQILYPPKHCVIYKPPLPLSRVGSAYVELCGNVHVAVDYAVGIDLGTTFSCVAVYKDGKIHTIRNSFDMATTPSVVYVAENEACVGEEAIIKGQRDPAHCISGSVLHYVKLYTAAKQISNRKKTS